MYKNMLSVSVETLYIIEIPGIGQLIQIEYGIPGGTPGQNVAGTNKTCSACNKKRCH